MPDSDFVLPTSSDSGTNDILKKIAEMNAASNKPPDVTVKVTLSEEEKKEIEAQEKALKPPVGDSPKLRRKKEISFRLGWILNQFGGLESNIPVQKDHEYWTLLEELRAL